MTVVEELRFVGDPMDDALDALFPRPKRERKPSPDMEALGDFLAREFVPGRELTSDDLAAFWEARQVSDQARGPMLAGAVSRRWLRGTGRITKSGRASRKGAWLQVYTVARR